MELNIMWHKQLKQLRKQLINNDATSASKSSSIKSAVNNQPAEISFNDYCVAQHIQPMTQDRVTPKKITTTKIIHHPLGMTLQESFDFIDISEVNVEFFRHGQRKLPKELRQDKYPIRATLDLHGFTKAHALYLVEQFIENATAGSCVKIIHGLGINSPSNQPVLLGTIRKYLQYHPLVLAYSYAAPNHGGNGVTLVKLTK